MSAIGGLYIHGFGVEKDYAEALKWFHKAAAKGNAAAMGNIGWAYKNGNGVIKNLTEVRPNGMKLLADMETSSRCA